MLFVLCATSVEQLARNVDGGFNNSKPHVATCHDDAVGPVHHHQRAVFFGCAQLHLCTVRLGCKRNGCERNRRALRALPEQRPVRVYCWPRGGWMWRSGYVGNVATCVYGVLRMPTAKRYNDSTVADSRVRAVLG